MLQIYQRIKGDIISVRARLTEERAERGKAGGGNNKKFPAFDLARAKLLDTEMENAALKKQLLLVDLETAQIRRQVAYAEAEKAGIQFHFVQEEEIYEENVFS